MGFVKPPDVDQTADGEVVTTQVPVERVGVLGRDCTQCDWPVFWTEKLLCVSVCVRAGIESSETI